MGFNYTSMESSRRDGYDGYLTWGEARLQPELWGIYPKIAIRGHNPPIFTGDIDVCVDIPRTGLARLGLVVLGQSGGNHTQGGFLVTFPGTRCALLASIHAIVIPPPPNTRCRPSIRPP
eukprot:COSAG01_NODE_455_length_16792_cov_112.440424_4_plen_119_part_00